MRLRVILGGRLEFCGKIYGPSDEFEASEIAAGNLLRLGLVVPADGEEWPAGLNPSKDSIWQPPAPMKRENKRGRPPTRKPARIRWTPCNWVGEPRCGKLVQGGGRCPEHARMSNNTGKPYSSWHDVPSKTLARWRKLSERIRRERPLCESGECAALFEPLRPASRHVDHIDDLGLKGPKAFDPANLQALCITCHSRKTASERFGRD
jgi:5-methylcytosine-specific restriction protein A